MGRSLAIFDTANDGRRLLAYVPSVVQFGIDGSYDHATAVKVQDDGEGVVGTGMVRTGTRHGRHCTTTPATPAFQPHQLCGGGTERRGGNVRPGRESHEEPRSLAQQHLHVPCRPGKVGDLNFGGASTDGIDGMHRRDDVEDVANEVLLPRPSAKHVSHVGGRAEVKESTARNLHLLVWFGLDWMIELITV